MPKFRSRYLRLDRQPTLFQIWDYQNSLDMWDQYIGTDRSNVSPYASPARATDLSGLPPATIRAPFTALISWPPLGSRQQQWQKALRPLDVSWALRRMTVT